MRPFHLKCNFGKCKEFSISDAFAEVEYSEPIEGKELEGVVMPAKVEILKGYIFRQNNPAVVGAHVLQGRVKTSMPVMNRDGKILSEVKSIQAEQETVSEAEKGKQVAISLPGVTVGRQINEGDILYSGVPEDDFKKLKELKQLLTKEDIEYALKFQAIEFIETTDIKKELDEINEELMSLLAEDEDESNSDDDDIIDIIEGSIDDDEPFKRANPNLIKDHNDALFVKKMHHYYEYWSQWKPSNYFEEKIKQAIDAVS